MRRYIYDRTRELLRFVVYILLPLAGGGWVWGSCTDFLTIYPTDRTVGTDFWKKKADVDEMVNGCYLSMISGEIQERVIIWGAYRSDELVKLADYRDNNSTSLDNIAAVNLLPTNNYNSWAAFYKVINNCNIVLNHATDVMAEDPEFTEGDYHTVRAQMLALRSLCYFYLVRAFRDVPFTQQSYEDDSQSMAIAQSAPGVVLQQCIDDLLEAENYVMKSGAYGYNDWRNWGYLTRDAVDAILADIYLWRASMTHNSSDYQQVINYVDKVIEAKDNYYNQNHTAGVSNSKETDKYHLEDGDMAFVTIFSTNQGNAHESILEWQYNGKNNSNTTLENYYYQSGTKDNHKTTSILMASQIFNTVAENANTTQGQKVYISRNDYRFWNNVYEANNEEAQQLSVRKMISTGVITDILTRTTGDTKTNSRAFEEFRQNWIVYRLTDLMLMKAEALEALSTDNDDQETLKEAFDLVQAVNKRSMIMTAKDTLKFEDYNTKNAIELLVLAERERELCFEGKRWFDLMRFSYRHMQGVNINQTLADTNQWSELYPQMLKFIIRKYGEGGEGDAVSYKLKSEPYLYWPILESETKVNRLLKQNPVYVQEKSTSKN